MKTYKIGTIPGDGIGPEVAGEALNILRTVSAIDSFSYEIIEYPYSGEHYLKTKELVPDRVIEEWKALDAVFLGAIGHPDVETGLVERSVILGLRFGLDLYINLRPIRLYAEHLCPLKDKKPEDVDLIVVRENTEGLYAQIGGTIKKGTPDEVATVVGVYTGNGVERAIRYGFDLAEERRKARGHGKLTLVDKANAIRPQDIWTQRFEKIGKDHPDIEQDHAYVDACCMWLVKNPEWFDVIVTTNLFGDIITDLGAMIQGGMGIAASGNIHPGKHGMFEPIHGSAPKYAGQNVANPLGAIAAISMMLEFLGEKKSAQRIEKAIERLLSSKRIPSLDAKSGLSTSEIGAMVTEEVTAVNVESSES